MRNTRKSGQILRSKKRPRPTLRSGRGNRTKSNTSRQIPARVIEADSAFAVRVPDPRSVQLIQRAQLRPRSQSLHRAELLVSQFPRGAYLPSKYLRINSRLRSLEAHTQTITAPPPRN